MKRQSMLSGAAVLAAGMMAVKGLGLVCKIFLSRLLGTAGMGYFSASYTVFTAVYALTVSGLSGAASQCTAAFMAQSRYGDVRRLLTGSLRWYALLGTAGSAALAALSPLFCLLIHSPASRPGLLAMAPAVAFSCVAAALRGHFEGLHTMTPTSLSQVIEAAAKVVCAVGLPLLVLSAGRRQFESTGAVLGQNAASWEQAQSVLLPYASAAALLGISLSTLAGADALVISLRRRKTIPAFLARQAPPALSGREHFRRLWKLALPITASSVITSIGSLIDLFTIPSGIRRAAAAMPEAFAAFTASLCGEQQLHELLYGAYTMALAVFHLAPSFTGLLGKSALPALTRSRVRQNSTDARRQTRQVVLLSAAVCVPAGLCMALFAPLLTRLLYGAPQGVQGIVLSMRLLAPGTVFCGMAVPLYGVLQGLGRADLPVFLLLAGSAVKLSGNLVLIPLPQVGLAGAAISTDLCYLLVLLGCAYAVRRALPAKKENENRRGFFLTRPQKSATIGLAIRKRRR